MNSKMQQIQKFRVNEWFEWNINSKIRKPVIDLKHDQNWSNIWEHIGGHYGKMNSVLRERYWVPPHYMELLCLEVHIETRSNKKLF